jgi:hypothetical protein
VDPNFLLALSDCGDLLCHCGAEEAGQVARESVQKIKIKIKKAHEVV